MFGNIDVMLWQSYFCYNTLIVQLCCPNTWKPVITFNSHNTNTTSFERGSFFIVVEKQENAA